MLQNTISDGVLHVADPEPAPPPPLIRLRGLTKSFGPNTVLNNVSFDIPEGRTTAIIGPSGTGKSVMLKHIVGLIRPDAGEVLCFGTDMARAPEPALYAARRRMGMLFQDGALFDSFTVGENVAFPLVHHAPQMSDDERRAKVNEKLALVGLPGTYDRATASLSGGQRKRVGLARAIIMEPEIVLFDEPNSGLDPITSDAIDQLICDMKQALGVTFVVITHDIVGTVRVADYIAMLYRGDLIAWGPTAEVLRAEHPVLRAFLQRNLILPPAGGSGDARLPAVQ
jgi:phospholipid/cholesterol/gamma-HCH transport system ATP-binding protein